MARIARFAVPSLPHRGRGEALGRAVGETHRRYSAVVNSRKRVTGHVFKGRGSSLQSNVLSIEPHKGSLTNLSTAAPFLLVIYVSLI
jgi:hypothetical protein